MVTPIASPQFITQLSVEPIKEGVSLIKQTSHSRQNVVQMCGSLAGHLHCIKVNNSHPNLHITQQYYAHVYFTGDVYFAKFLQVSF